MLGLTSDERNLVWQRVRLRIESYLGAVTELPVAPELNPTQLRSFLDALRFEVPVSGAEAVDIAADGLTRWQVHTPHPQYFGLFNPAPTTMGIAADALVAAFNPQLAAWSHSPFAIEVEQYLIRCLGQRFGYDPASTDGAMASGGMEANHTAVLAALAHRYPNLRRGVSARFRRNRSCTCRPRRIIRS